MAFCGYATACLSIHSFDGILGCFQSREMMNGADVSICVEVCVDMKF